MLSSQEVFLRTEIHCPEAKANLYIVDPLRPNSGDLYPVRGTRVLLACHTNCSATASALVQTQYRYPVTQIVRGSLHNSSFLSFVSNLPNELFSEP